MTIGCPQDRPAPDDRRRNPRLTEYGPARGVLGVMKRLMTLAAAVAVAFCGAAGTAQADTPAPASNIKAVVVLIGANDYGFVPPRRP
jgi:hypothetical protein